MKLLLGFFVAFGIGVFCRLTRIPSPAPQAILGSMLVVAMSVGYAVTGQVMDRLKTQTIVPPTSSSNSQGSKHASHPVQPVR
jgi:XapX domain-containing protein